MDMKRILQALDGVSTKPVEGANDMKKFLSVVTEGANPHKVALPVQMAMQHYATPKETPPLIRTESLLKGYLQELDEEAVEAQAHKRQLINQYAQTIADRVMMRESRLNERVVPGQETPPGINRLTGQPIAPEAAPEAAPAPTGPRGSNLKMTVLQGLKAGTYKGFAPKLSLEEIDAAIAYKQSIGDLQETPIDMTGDPNDPTIYGHEKANPMSLKGRIMSARAQLKELAQLADSDSLVAWEEIVKKAQGGMFMGLEQNIEQIRHGIEELAAKRKRGGIASRGIDKNIGEDNDPCWKDYKQVGMKKKGGKTVPNCVPKK